VPFTPFHFGPGAVIKAATPKYFSFLLFCGSQVVMDFESGYYLLRGEYPVHRFFHTFIGAALVAVICTVLGRIVWNWGARLIENEIRLPVMSWTTAFFTAFIGTWSHVVLDSIMHRDMRPFGPFSDQNPFLYLVGPNALHNICIITGFAGAIIWILRSIPRGSVE